MSVLWSVIHKPSRKLLHIRINDGDGTVLLTDLERRDYWLGHSEAQAHAQASMLGDDYAVAQIEAEG